MALNLWVDTDKKSIYTKMTRGNIMEYRETDYNPRYNCLYCVYCHTHVHKSEMGSLRTLYSSNRCKYCIRNAIRNAIPRTMMAHSRDEVKFYILICNNINQSLKSSVRCSRIRSYIITEYILTCNEISMGSKEVIQRELNYNNN